MHPASSEVSSSHEENKSELSAKLNQIPNGDINSGLSVGETEHYLESIPFASFVPSMDPSLTDTLILSNSISLSPPSPPPTKNYPVSVLKSFPNSPVISARSSAAVDAPPLSDEPKQIYDGIGEVNIAGMTSEDKLRLLEDLDSQIKFRKHEVKTLDAILEKKRKEAKLMDYEIEIRRNELDRLRNALVGTAAPAQEAPPPSLVTPGAKTLGPTSSAAWASLSPITTHSIPITSAMQEERLNDAIKESTLISSTNQSPPSPTRNTASSTPNVSNQPPFVDSNNSQNKKTKTIPQQEKRPVSATISQSPILGKELELNQQKELLDSNVSTASFSQKKAPIKSSKSSGSVAKAPMLSERSKTMSPRSQNKKDHATLEKSKSTKDSSTELEGKRGSKVNTKAHRAEDNHGTKDKSTGHNQNSTQDSNSKRSTGIKRQDTEPPQMFFPPDLAEELQLKPS